jgi:hypothetical protein
VENLENINDVSPKPANTRMLWKDFVTIGISFLSLLIAVGTLFLSQLGAPSISPVIGPEILVYYPPDGGFGLYVPSTFLNDAPRTGTIIRTAIMLFRASTPEERFYMQWRGFSSLRPDAPNSYARKLDESAHAITVPGHASITNMVWFTWRTESNPQFQLVEGPYKLIFYYWTSVASKPNSEEHEFFIDQYILGTLDEYRRNKKSTIVELILDKQLSPNRLMNTYEAKTLLGK